MNAGLLHHKDQLVTRRWVQLFLCRYVGVGIFWTAEPSLPDSHPLLQAQRSGYCGLPTKKHSVAVGLAHAGFEFSFWPLVMPLTVGFLNLCKG